MSPLPDQPPAWLSMGELARALNRDVDHVRRLLKRRQVTLMKEGTWHYVSLDVLEREAPDLYMAFLRRYRTRVA